MWTSDRGRKCPVEESAAGLGAVTLGENPAGVYLEGERRWTEVYSPGGYHWRPALGEQVLVLKAGGERENSCIVGRKQGRSQELEPGQVTIASGTGQAAVKLHPSGDIELCASGDLDLRGYVTVNGVSLRSMIENIVEELTGGSVV